MSRAAERSNTVSAECHGVPDDLYKLSFGMEVRIKN